MGKKSNSRRRSQARTAPRAAGPSQARATAPSQVRAPAPATQPAAPRTVDLAEEYRYVYSDLKRIGILVASMLGLLIVLALIAQYVF